MSNYIFSAVIVVFVITFSLRAAPFVFLSRMQNSQILKYLGYAMPAGVMLILVVFSLQDVRFELMEDWAPHLAGVLATVVLHLSFRRVLVSLLGGVGLFALVLSLL